MIDDSGNGLKVERPPCLFISYAHEDVGAVKEFCHRLERGGFGRWLDSEQLSVGQRLALELDSAIDGAASFVACLTPTYAQKAAEDGYVRREIDRALAVLDGLPEGMPFLLPVEIVPCEIPAILARRDLIRGNIRSVDDVEILFRSVYRALEQRGLIGLTLVAEDGPDRGKIWHMGGPMLIIGRAAGSQCRLGDSSVSAAHARIEIRKKAVFLHHQSESSSTCVTGKGTMRLDPGHTGAVRISDGDRIHVGETVLHVNLAAVDFRNMAVTTTQAR